MSSTEEALAEIAKARDLARESVDELERRKRDAYNSGDYDAYDRYAAAYRDALTAEDKATRRLIAGILAPSDSNLASLKAATASLQARIAAFKADAAQLSDLAASLTIVTQAILLFGLL
jgi:hypothetical protein